jgi:O-6-methylguanine DNA methyltransferase
MRSAPHRTRLGTGWAAFDTDRVVLLVLPGGDRPAPRGDAPPAVKAVLARVEAWFEGHNRHLVDEGLCEAVGRTRFEREVYRLVSAIPPGQTRTYGRVAAAAGRPRAARAVGAAMARNPYAPLIPCHRLVGADGSLRGYAGGLQMNAALLSEEGALA